MNRHPTDKKAIRSWWAQIGFEMTQKGLGFNRDCFQSYKLARCGVFLTEQFLDLNRNIPILVALLESGCSPHKSPDVPRSAGRSAQATYELAQRAAGSNDFAGAEKLALESAAKAWKESPVATNRVVSALYEAGLAAEQLNNFKQALGHFSEAGALTEIKRDGREWATIHHAMAHTLDVLGQYPEAERLLREVVRINTETLGLEHPETLRSRMNLANTLNDQWRTPEAEAEHRAVL